MDIKYDNQTRDYNIYTEEFFGGSDVTIYINGEKVDIAYVQFSVQENLKPLYGYKSRTFDDVAVGNRIVVGTIKVPVSNNITDNIMTENVATINQTISVPSFIYSSDTIDNSYENSYNYDVNGKVYEYQRILKKLGYDTFENGIMDRKTKIAINDFMRDNGLQLFDYFSLDVINALTQTNENMYKTTFSVKLKYGPGDDFKDQNIEIPANSQVVLVEEYNSEWVKVQVNDSEKGYIKKNILKKV